MFEKRTEVLYSRIKKQNKDFIKEEADKHGISEAQFVDHIFDSFRNMAFGWFDEKTSRGQLSNLVNSGFTSEIKPIDTVVKVPSVPDAIPKLFELSCPKCDEIYNHCNQVEVIVGDDYGQTQVHAKVTKHGIDIPNLEHQSKPIGPRQRGEPAVRMHLDCENCKHAWFFDVYHHKGIQYINCGT